MSVDEESCGGKLTYGDCTHIHAHTHTRSSENVGEILVELEEDNGQ